MVPLQILLVTVNFFIFIGVIAICIALITFLYSYHLDAPFVTTPKGTLDKIFRALDIQPGNTVYELGCGDGRFLFAAARHYPHTRFVGIELNPFLYIFLRFRQRFSGTTNVVFKRENFFDTDLSEAGKIYAYLSTPVMQSLYPTFIRKLKGVRVASRAFQIKDMRPSSVIEISKDTGSHGEHLLYVYDFVPHK